MYVTPIYAAALAMLFALLSIRTLLLRRSLGIGLGDGGDERMQRAVRAHGNFAEYAPLTLLLLLMLELQGVQGAWIHGLGLCLLVGRISHAFGVSRAPENYVFRVFGMAMTLTALISAASSVIVIAVAA